MYHTTEVLQQKDSNCSSGPSRQFQNQVASDMKLGMLDRKGCSSSGQAKVDEDKERNRLQMNNGAQNLDLFFDCSQSVCGGIFSSP